MARDEPSLRFQTIEKIQYEGPDSKNPLAFRHYNPDEVVGGKTMKVHLRFSFVYWHTFRGTGADPFGPGCAERPIVAAKRVAHPLLALLIAAAAGKHLEISRHNRYDCR